MIPALLADVLGCQLGMATNHQFRSTVPCPQDRRALLRAGRLRRATPRVVELPAPLEVPERALLLAVLDAGPRACLFGESAATFMGIGRFRLFPLHVARPRRSGRAPNGALIHNLRNYDDLRVTDRRGVPMPSPEWIVRWIARLWAHRFPPEIAADRIAATLDHAWRQALIDGPEIHRLAEETGGRGNSGIVALRTALEKRPPDYVPAGSALEDRWERALPWDLHRRFTRQRKIMTSKGRLLIPDYSLDAWPLLVEVNGEGTHTSISDRAHDLDRYRELLGDGHSVLIAWEYDVFHDMTPVVDAIRRCITEPDAVPTLHRPTMTPWGQEPGTWTLDEL